MLIIVYLEEICESVSQTLCIKNNARCINDLYHRFVSPIKLDACLSMTGWPTKWCLLVYKGENNIVPCLSVVTHHRIKSEHHHNNISTVLHNP